jgi:hypothetical protein
MSKRNAALEALTGGKKPTANVVELKSELAAEAAARDERGEPAAAPAPVRKPTVRQTVANSSARSMLYLPPKAKRKFKEIAFHEDRKEHDVYIEALREYLERKGHKGLL